MTAPRDLSGWISWLEGLNPDRIELGLDRVRTVLNRLRLDFSRCHIIEVAGTNGKGSTAALIAATLDNAAIPCGLYTSPHLMRFNERIRINGEMIGDELLCSALSRVEEAAEGIPLTYFEFTTLAALIAFARAGVRVLVLEIGLGGRLDAVNVLDAGIAVITSIGLDHTQILGATAEAIAHEKAGIIKDGTTVITGRIAPGPLGVIADAAAAHGARLLVEDRDFAVTRTETGRRFTRDGESRDLPEPKIPPICLGAALCALQELAARGLAIPEPALQAAVADTVLPGRMQRVFGTPAIYLDVAHNPPAAEHLRNLLQERPVPGRRLLVAGMLADKDIESTLGILRGAFDRFYVCTLGGGRGEQADRLVRALGLQGAEASCIDRFDTVGAGLQAALMEAADEDEIIVCGSFLTVRDALQALPRLADGRGVKLPGRG